MTITIRPEAPADAQSVEELTREAFWGAMDHPTCDGEHLLVHRLRSSTCLIPQLNLVAEVDGCLAGHVIYSRAKVVSPDGGETEVLTFGPLSVLPAYQRKGVGAALMRCSISEAARLGYRAIIFYGHPDYYPRFGFWRASAWGITAPDGSSWDALMALELYPGALDAVSGQFVEDGLFEMEKEEIEAFDRHFPPKAPAELLSASLLEPLPKMVRQALERRNIRYLGQLHRFSGAELLRWEGIDEVVLAQINTVLVRWGYGRKLFPSSPILQLAQLGIRNAEIFLLRQKDDISLYQVHVSGQYLILKVFDKLADTREIAHYQLLAHLGVPTLPVLGYTERGLLLPDLNRDPAYRLAQSEDLENPSVVRAIGVWYRQLHTQGRLYLLQNGENLYDEADLITPASMEQVAAKTNTRTAPFWKVFHANFPEIRRRLEMLPHTLTYHDFHWSNLVVGRTEENALMLDFHLLGKGIPYSDLRNVTQGLPFEMQPVFLEAYGPLEQLEEQQRADHVLAPLAALVLACKQVYFPDWAKPSLKELQDGTLLRQLNHWLFAQ